MSEKNNDITNEAKVSDPEKQNSQIEIDPAILLECVDEVDIMVNAHVNLLRAMKKLVWRFRKSGMSPGKAAAAAFELHKRASNKANSLVPNGEPEEDSEEEIG